MRISEGKGMAGSSLLNNKLSGFNHLKYPYLLFFYKTSFVVDTCQEKHLHQCLTNSFFFFFNFRDHWIRLNTDNICCNSYLHIIFNVTHAINARDNINKLTDTYLLGKEYWDKNKSYWVCPNSFLKTTHTKISPFLGQYTYTSSKLPLTQDQQKLFSGTTN